MVQSKARNSISAAEVEEEFARALKSVRIVRARAAQGKALEILEAASALIREGGFEGFSVRQVAERAGISLAALQYHFATRADLTMAMIEHRLNWYEEELLALLRGLGGHPETAFLKVINWFLDDAASEGTTSFSLHFWGLADYDDQARKALDGYMKVYREFLALLIRRMNPLVSRMESLTRGAMLTSLIDGTVPITGHGRPKHPEFKALRSSIRRLALVIAKAQSPCIAIATLV